LAAGNLCRQPIDRDPERVSRGRQTAIDPSLSGRASAATAATAGQRARWPPALEQHRLALKRSQPENHGASEHVARVSEALFSWRSLSSVRSLQQSLAASAASDSPLTRSSSQASLPSVSLAPANCGTNAPLAW